jgi:hypothetical protein
MSSTRLQVLMISTAVLFLAGSVRAATPTFTNLTEDDFNNVTKEFSANMANTSVMGAESLGRLFGVELALVGGMTSSPKIKDIVARSGGSGMSDLYHAGLAAGVTVPFGITGEAVVLPKLSLSGADFQMYSLAAKISLNEDLIPIIPFNLAIRGFYSNSNFNFSQDAGGVTGTVKNKDTVTGLQLLASPRLPILEPYAGVGFLQADNKLDVDGTGTVFDSSYTSGQSAEKKPTTTEFLLGVNAKLLLLSLGVEYAHAFDTDRYTAKIGFAF